MNIKYIIEIASVVVGGGGFIAVLKFLFPSLGLKRQKKIELNAELAKDKIDAIKRVIRFEQKANEIEDVNIVHPELFNVDNVNPKEDEDRLIYMTIVENKDNLNEFWNELSEIRRLEDTWLSQRVSAYLLYAEKYIMQFMEFLKQLEYSRNDLYPFGLLIAADIQKWQRKLDKILTQELNDISFKIEHHGGEDWKYEKEVLEDEYQKTVLYGLIHKKDREVTNLLCCILTNYAINIAGEDYSMEIVAQHLITEGFITENQTTDSQVIVGN